MKAQLELFLANVPGLLELDDFLPKQAGAEARFNLCDHQQDALDWLALIRTEGKTIVCAQPMPAAVVAEYLGAVEP